MLDTSSIIFSWPYVLSGMYFTILIRIATSIDHIVCLVCVRTQDSDDETTYYIHVPTLGT